VKDVPKVVVGSRAEAKAVRAAAQNAQREAALAVKTAEKLARTRARSKPSLASTASGSVVVWGTFDIAAVICALTMLIAVKEAALGSALLAAMPAAAQIASRAAVLGLFYMFLVAVLAALASRKGRTFVEAFGLRSGAVSASRVAGSAVLVGGLLVVTRTLALIWGATATAVGWNPPGTGELTDVFGAGGFGLVLTIAVVVLAGPFVEELVFRGLLLPALLERFGLWQSIVVCAAVFAMSHATAWTLVPALVLGVACGWLTARRGSLWSAIVLHSLYNAVIVAAAFWIAGQGAF
jgi:membrane protease YdiL (CAAX protease family)